MKKKLFIILLFVSNFLMAQTINDANFANAIRNLYPTLIESNSNNLTAAAATYNGMLDFSAWGNTSNSAGMASSFATQPKLTTINGIQFFPQLRGLDVSNQQLTTIPALSNTVIFIIVTNNQLTSLSSLPTELEYIRLSQNRLSQIPLLPSGLRALKADNNLLTSLPTLPSSLAYLDVSFNMTLGCLPNIPNNLVNNGLPTSNLVTYVFSTNARRRVDYSNTSIRCIPNSYNNSWGQDITLPMFPSICSLVPTLRFSVIGASQNQNNGEIRVTGTIGASNSKVEYRLNNGVYQDEGIFSQLGAGSYTITARRKSESNSCLNPEASINVVIPVLSQQNIYVSPDGNDNSGNGTENQPFKSISKAISSTFDGSKKTIFLAPGVYIEDDVIKVPSTVSIIGSGSNKTFILVNVYYNPFDYPFSKSNPEPLERSYIYDDDKYVIRLLGGNSTLKGFSVDGQRKKCLGAIIGRFSPNTHIEDLNIQDFSFTACMLSFSDNLVITKCFIKNSTHGLYSGDKGLIHIDGKNIVISKNQMILDENIGGYAIKSSLPIHDQLQFFQRPDLRKEEQYTINFTIEDNTILINSWGFWNRFQGPAFVLENSHDCKNCIIRNNTLNNVLSLVDHGPHSNGSHYSGPRYNIYNNTFILDERGFAVEADAPNIEFHHNYITGGSGLESFTSSNPFYEGINVHHNVFYNLDKNVLTNWRIAPLNFKFNNNTIIDHKGTSIILGRNNRNGNFELKNNLFANIDPAITTSPVNRMDLLANSNTVISNNLFFNIAPYGNNSIVANPQLIGSGLKPHTYFKLKKESPAIDAGLVITGTTDGFQGAAPDLGAFELNNEIFASSSERGGSLGIGTDMPATSAALDVFSNSQGILVPRLSLAAIQNMPSPAEGLLAFCSDCTPKSFYISDGLNWRKQEEGVLLSAINAQVNTDKSGVGIGVLTTNSSAALEIDSNARGLLLPRILDLEAVANPTEGLMVYLKTSTNKGVYFYNGKSWQKAFNTVIAFPVNNNSNITTNLGVGINTNTPHPSSIMDITSTSKGFLPPRLGKSQMEAIKSPALGLMVYCFDCPSKGYYYNNGSHWQNSVVTPPSVPQKVVATPNGTNVTITYAAPATNGGSPITSYTIVGIPGNITQRTSNTSATFSGLQVGVSYVFLVTATNSAGVSESASSNPVIIGLPDSPSNAYAFQGPAAGTAEVFFTSPTHTGGTPIVNYTITTSPGGATVTTTQSPATVTGLALNTTYTFTIRANNANGSSLPALTNAITAITAIASTTLMLDNVSASAAVAYSLRKLRTAYAGPAIEIRRESDNQTIQVGFDNLGNLNTGLISNFCGASKGYVTRWYDQSGNGRDAVNTTPASQPLIYNGLSIETVLGKPALQFTGSSIFLRTTQNVLANSNELTTLTTAYAPYYATLIQHGNGIGNAHIRISREFANYMFRVNNSSVAESAFIDYGTDGVFRIITSRNSITDTRRHIRRNGNNSGTTSSAITSNFTNDHLTIGGGFNGHMGEHIEFNSFVSLAAVDQMENNQSVYYSITQPCLAGAVPPSVPTQVFANSASSNQVAITFTPSSSSGSRVINYYEVTSIPGNIKAIGSSSPIIVSGLTQGVSYSFEVKAVNFCDDSSPTVITNSIILGQIGAPTQVIATKGVAEGSAVVSFTAPGFTNNQTITGYTVTSFPDNIQVTGTASPLTITGLSNEKKYTFRVVAHTATTTSLPSLASNSIYAHTQILNDLPTPRAAFGLRKLLSSYSGPVVTIRRNDNTTKDIGFLPNGELDEAALFAFVGSGNGFVTTWYDQSSNARHATMTVAADQPMLVNNGVICRHQGQPTLRFHSSDRILVPALTNVRALHTIFSMGDANSGGTDTTWLNFGSLIVHSYTSGFGGGGLNHDWQSSLANRLMWNGLWYETATLFINGDNKTNVADNYGPNIREYKSLIGNVNNNINASFSIRDIRASGSNYSTLANIVFFGQNISDTDRNKLDKRQSACFELGF